MNFLTDFLKNYKDFNELIKYIDDKKTPIAVYGAAEGQISHIVYSLWKYGKEPVIIIAKDELKARKIYDDLKSLNLSEVSLYTDRNILLYDRYFKSLDNMKIRLKSIYDVMKNNSNIVVTTLNAIGDKISSRDIFSKHILEFKVGEEISLQDVSKKLIDMGYERTSQVESFAQFAIRGYILDVYTAQGAFRIELFDTEIDSIRNFNINTQRSIENLNEVEVIPANDLILEDKDRVFVADELSLALNNSKSTEDEKLQKKFNKYIEDLKSGKYIQNMDLLIPFMKQESLSSILEYLNKNTVVILEESNDSVENYSEKEIEFKDNLTDLIIQGEALKEHENIKYQRQEIISKLKYKNLLLFNSFTVATKDFSPKAIINLKTRASVRYKGKMKLFIDDLKNYMYRGYKVVIMGGDEERAKKLQANLIEEGISSKYSYDFDNSLKSGETVVTVGGLSEGFEIVDLKFVIINYREIYGGTRESKKSRKKRKALNFEDLKIGDYVVHESHGVGKYVGTKRLEVKGIIKDYVLIEYKGEDKLFLPIENLDSIYKYTSQEGKKPKINKLNSAEWNKTKSKAKKSVEDMADDLIKLYAKRMQEEGHAFEKDTPWQREFEDAFEFEETEGQLRSTEEIKRDMESKKPMDRLLCADVGYGKTEVALRAAFKAIMDGKQVAFLVPTTVLAKQHYDTIIDRFKDFPVKTSLLSRFRTVREQAEDIKGIKSGVVDIVVGTHRLLSKEIKFKDLGLLIVDEEQRFGVKDKERLKMIKENVDTLTLTATPIPRTLQMSMVGIRDMSVIEEPPEERFPVQTYVLEYNDTMVRDAILREMARGGQVYFVYNRVSNMENKLLELRELIPEATFGIAHGQMQTRILENNMMSFINHEFDVLLCSTIIETGLDMKNVNTMIVADSNKLGLSQLYQLRGRIGRSNKIAYAYFTYEPNLSLTEIAQKRLKSIKEFTEFGSGYKIALKDLEIRGSGSILGSRQSGHINSVGYDLYIKYLKDALSKLKGEEVNEQADATIDLNIDAYIPTKYIDDDDLRIEIYKKIASITSDDDYSDLVDELIDRFSDIPKEVSNLMDTALLRHNAKTAGISSITQKGEIYEIKLNKMIGIEEIKNIQMEFENIEVMVGEEVGFKLSKLTHPFEDLNKVTKILKLTQKNHKEL
ncbi:Transcription-repair-coupling factor [Peptoniphilus sp. ING2-D1G]|nr:Transcription-repair-coupling factor [Peptoniphilus sp. ING2-D1G]